MKEQLETRMQQRVKMLYRYTNAMERGDTDTVNVVLEEAQHDSVLERMLLEINEVYEIEDRTVAHPDDVAIAQEMLLATFAGHVDGVSNELSTSEAVGNESAAIGKGKETVGIEPLPIHTTSQLSVRHISPRKWY